MAFFLSPVLNEQQFDANGEPLAGGLILTYLAGTTTPVVTYKTSVGTAHTNPIVLDSSGNFPTGTQLWLDGGKTYKFVVQTSTGVTLRTIDNITGINDSASIADEWPQYTASAFSYLSPTSFSVVGDQTNLFQVNRRVKTQNTGGTSYGTILSSSYSAPNTTVTLTNTSGVLDAGLSAVYYGLLAPINPSVPANYALKPVARVDVATATSVDLTNITDDIRLTGTTTVAGFVIPVGRIVRVLAGGSFTLTNSVALVIQNGLSLALRSGDTFTLRATAANVVEVLEFTRGLQPAFEATRVAVQSITTATFTKVQFNTETFDIGGAYDAVTNYRFTPTTPGIYQVDLYCEFAAGVDLSLMQSLVYKNGVALRRASARFSGTGDQQGVTCSALVQMDGVTDYIEGFAYQATGSSQNLATGSYFSAALVGQ